jgi:acetyl/propionyl-CoA carboxylase alpha subunit
LKLHIEMAGKIRSIDYKPGESTVTLDGEAIEAHAQVLRPGVLSLIIDGRAWRVVLEEGIDEPAVRLSGERIPYRIDDPRSLQSRRARSGGTDGPINVKASMPGRVVRILAQQGETVDAHQGVVVIEAMKMQNELKSPKAGRVSELRVAAGDTVSAGDVLAVIE